MIPGTGNRRTIAGGTGPAKDYTIGLINNQFMAFIYDGTTPYYASSGVVPVTGASAPWYHVAGTFDGSKLKIYVNGELKNEMSASWAQATSGADFWIGSEYCCNSGSNNNNLNGLLDEVSVYRRALPVQDILEHYQTGISDDRTAPAVPVLDAVATPTYDSVITLSGTKDSDASVRINGSEIAGIDGSDHWSTSYVLLLGQNILHITSRDAAGNESAEVTATVELAPAKGVDPDILGLWHFDGNWKDFSGNSNHGYAYNGPAFSSDAKVGTKAASFDGVNDYVQVMMDVPERNFTIDLWAKTDTGGGLLSVNAGNFAGSSGNDRHMYVSNSGNACFRVYNGSTWCSAAKVNDNIWHHWLFVTETGVGQKFYLDGVLVGTNPYDHSDFTAQDRVTIGYSGDKGYFKGLVDELCILKRAIHADEARLRFDSSDSSGVPPDSPTVDPVPAVTNDYIMNLSGLKTADTAVWINNREVYPRDGSLAWNATYVLDAGMNTLSVYARNAAGQLSIPATVNIEVVQGKTMDSDLVALWHLDGTWSDYSGNNNHLVPYSPNIDGALFITDAKVGAGAVTFDGVNDYAQITRPSSTLNIGAQSWSISAWVKSSYSGLNPMTVLARYECGWNNCSSPDGNANALYHLFLDRNGFATFGVRSDNSVSGNYLLVSDDNNIRDGQWHHVVGVLDRMSSMLRIYVDGLQKNAISSAGLDAVNDGGSPFVLGAVNSQNQYSNYYNGLIDEVSLYRRALRPAEVQELFNISADRTAPNKPSVSPVTSPTSNSTITLYGTKDADSSIRINNIPAVPLDSATNWQTSYSLQQLGDNVLSIAARDASGNQSEAVTVTVNLLPANQSDAGIVGLWHLDGTGTDYSGSGNDLTPRNTLVFTADAIVGSNAASFNGTVDYLDKQSPSTTLNIGSQSWTISAWIKTANKNTDTMMILERYECGWTNCSTASAGARYYLSLNTGGAVVFMVNSDDGNSATVFDTQDLRDERWHYVVGVLDRTNRLAGIFVDGTQRNSLAAAAIGSINDGGSPLMVGRHQAGTQMSQYFKGLIDEITVYNRTLSQSEVSSQYAAGQAGYVRPMTPTVNPVASPMFSNVIKLFGAKEANTSIRINGIEVAATDSAATWTTEYSLQPGVNTLLITSLNASGDESDPVTLTIEVLSAKQLDPDIAGLWHLDGNWSDFSGNGNHLTPTNSANFSEDAQVGRNAGMFSGSAYGRRASGTGLPLGNSPRTFAAWIKPYSYPDASYNGIIAYGQMSCTGKGSLLSIKNDGRISMAFWCDDAMQRLVRQSS